MNLTELKDRITSTIRDSRYHRDIKSVAVFGSYAKGQARADSDLDLLIEFEPDSRVGFVKFVRLQDELIKSLGLKVDLVVRSSVNAYIRKEVLSSAKEIYAK
jgi:predicted nucleotidyltransferase